MHRLLHILYVYVDCSKERITIMWVWITQLRMCDGFGSGPTKLGKQIKHSIGWSLFHPKMCNHEIVFTIRGNAIQSVYLLFPKDNVLFPIQQMEWWSQNGLKAAARTLHSDFFQLRICKRHPPILQTSSAGMTEIPLEWRYPMRRPPMAALA